MNQATLQEKGVLLAQISCVLFAFFLPISPTLKSIFLVCSVLLLIVTCDYKKQLRYTFNTFWGRSALALVTFILIACLWSQAPSDLQWSVVGKYAKVLYLPILVLGFIDPRTRKWTINSYLAVIFITCLLSVLKAKGVLSIGNSDFQGEVFYNHIVTGFLVAFGSYLAGIYAYQHQGRLRFTYLLTLLFFSYQIIFINTGRTGYLLYFILMILLFVQIFSLKKALLVTLFFCALFILGYSQSNMMQIRVHNLVEDVKLLKQNKENTSLGFRIQFHNYAQSLFLTHPLGGIGTGGFKYNFSQNNPIPAWGQELTDPHSQYWLTLCEQGVIGLSLLLLFLSSLWITSFKLDETRPILLGILTAFCVGAFSDTILCYSIVGYLLVLMSALCFGELLQKKQV